MRPVHGLYIHVRKTDASVLAEYLRKFTGELVLDFDALGLRRIKVVSGRVQHNKTTQSIDDLIWRGVRKLFSKLNKLYLAHSVMKVEKRSWLMMLVLEKQSTLFAYSANR